MPVVEAALKAAKSTRQSRPARPASMLDRRNAPADNQLRYQKAIAQKAVATIPCPSLLKSAQLSASSLRTCEILPGVSPNRNADGECRWLHPGRHGIYREKQGKFSGDAFGEANDATLATPLTGISKIEVDDIARPDIVSGFAPRCRGSHATAPSRPACRG
jgi:hypothetical protein